MGTGLKKCMPMNLSARLVAAASFVIEIDEVLEAISTSGPTMPSICLRILSLSS